MYEDWDDHWLRHLYLDLTCQTIKPREQIEEVGKELDRRGLPRITYNEWKGEQLSIQDIKGGWNHG